MKKKLLVAISIISISLVACVSAATTVPMETAIPTSTFTSVPTQDPTPSITSVSTRTSTVRAAHCQVNNAGFDMSYGLAWANICEACYEGYREIYGLDTLAISDSDFINSRLFRESRSEPSLGAFGGMITFRGDEAHMLPPADGGANNVYGICHEIGHLVFPIADSYYFEAWADYAAAYRIIPYVWQQMGIDAWPQSYDYLVSDGPVDIRRRMEEGLDNADIYYQAVANLIAVDEAYGPHAIGQAILQTKASLGLSDFKKALVEATGDQAVQELFAIGP